MNTKKDEKRMFDLIVDVEDQLRHLICEDNFKAAPPVSQFGRDFDKIYAELESKDNLALQRYVDELLKKYAPTRPNGKVDTVFFYEFCCISAGTWSNFTHGTFSKETILKIIAGLKCNWQEAEQVLKLAGFYLTNSRMDRLVKAAILSGHNNPIDMYEILEYYSTQYPKEVKNYFKLN